MIWALNNWLWKQECESLFFFLPEGLYLTEYLMQIEAYFRYYISQIMQFVCFDSPVWRISSSQVETWKRVIHEVLRDFTL